MDVDQLTDLAPQLRSLAVAGIDGLDGDSLAEVALTAHNLRELAEFLEVTALGGLDACRHTDSAFGATTVGWFAMHAGVSHRSARDQLGIARLLDKDLALAAEAWLDGRIGRDHVRVLAGAANPRIRDQLAGRLDDLIGAVPNKLFDVWRDEVRWLARELDQDGPEPNDPTRTTASWGRSDAFAMLRAQFGEIDAEVVEQILENRTDELFREQARAVKQDPDLKVLTRNELRGHAIVRLLIESQAVDPDTATPAGTALHFVIHADLPNDTSPRGTDPDGGTDGDGSDPPTPDGARGSDGTAPDGCGSGSLSGWPDDDALSTATWRVTSPDGRRLDPAGLDTMLGGDVEIHPQLVDRDGNPLELGAVDHHRGPLEGRSIESLLFDPDTRTRLGRAAVDRLHLGRTKRLAPSDLRRVVLIRDGGCIYPGCDCTVGWADIHHLIFWENGGRTDVIVLVALCRRHHGVAHRKGWSLSAGGDGWFVWRTPTGLRFWSQRHGIQRTGPLPPETLAA